MLRRLSETSPRIETEELYQVSGMWWDAVFTARVEYSPADRDCGVGESYEVQDVHVEEYLLDGVVCRPTEWLIEQIANAVDAWVRSHLDYVVRTIAEAMEVE